MNKTEYQNTIKTSLAEAEKLCLDLRKLRNVKKLAANLPAIEGLMNSAVLDKAITDREAELKKVRAELGKARRIVKHLEEIEAIENGTEAVRAPAKKSQAAKPKAEAKAEPAKKPKTAKAAAVAAA